MLYEVKTVKWIYAMDIHLYSKEIVSEYLLSLTVNSSVTFFFTTDTHCPVVKYC